MKSLVDPSLELSDPNPDIHELFAKYDDLFFDGVLKSHEVTLEWSNDARMKL
jgi:hypothetical protein